MCTLPFSLHTSFRYMCNLRYINLDRINVTKDLEPLKTTRNCTKLITRSNCFRSLSKSYYAKYTIKILELPWGGCMMYLLLWNMYCIVSYACMQYNFVTTKGYIIWFLALALLYNWRNGEESFWDATVYYSNLLINS